jgi:two-component system, cell cycle sensor histidine kinase and response regulator CckA
MLFVAEKIEGDARMVEIDSVPGLVASNAIRATYSQNFTSTVEVIGAESPNERDAIRRHVTDLDQLGDALIQEYRKTIYIDPKKDTGILDHVIAAHAKYQRDRDRYFDLVTTNRHAESDQFLAQQLTPAYRQLADACAALIAYNNGTGIKFSGRMTASAAAMRWTVLAVIVAALIAAVITGFIFTKQIRAARELHEIETKFSLAFEISPNSMLISRRRDARIIAANEAFRRYYRVTNEDLRGKTAMDVGVWANDQERDDALKEYVRDGRLRNYVRRRKAADGTENTFLISAEPLHLDGEECLLAVGIDITDRIRTEEALARNAAELRTIFETADIGIALVDTDGHPIRCNPALENFLGYTNDELRQMSFAEFTHPEEAERDIQLFRRLLNDELKSYDIEKRYLRKDGVTVWGHLTVSATRDAAGKVMFVVAMVEDYSERKRAEAALRQSEGARAWLQEQLIIAQKLEALGQLAGGVAHDFNNMLAAIMLYLDMLKIEPGLSSQMAEALDELTKTARRAAGLTRQLLLFSRREPAQRVDVDLDVVTGNLLKMLERLIGAHFKLVHVHTDAPVWINADPGMIEQVIMNLVVNARDAMARGGRIELRTEPVSVDDQTARQFRDGKPGNFVRLIVSDTGCGMSPATLTHIFEPFFTTKEAGKGTGLGLATVFGIVQQHGGWIDVQSQEGKGSAFSIYLPAQLNPVAARPADLSRRAQVNGRETILLAEDNEQLRVITARILRQAGYRVIEAFDGKAAKQVLDDDGAAIDLLISDVIMPGVMGDELAHHLQRKGRTRVVLMSAYNTTVDPAALAAAGGAYLSKPFNTDRLLETVRATLDRASVPVVLS